MRTTDRAVTFFAVIIFSTSCSTPSPLDDFEQLTPTTIMEQPEPREQSQYSQELIAQGRYMVNLLGCGTCHTDGALIGEANRQRLLAGSGIGIAYSNPLQNKHPGVVYPANLTPDIDTGIGSWSEDQIVNMIRTGANKHNNNSLAVMPWPAYARIDDEDAKAIAAYLLSVEPVRHSVPRNVSPGQKATAPFVHFGIYRSKAEMDE